MKSTRLVSLGCKSTVLLVTLFAVAARGQDAAVRGRLLDTAERTKPTTGSLVAAAGPSVSVSKTAAVVGHEVCGVIRITNPGGQPLAIAAIVDTLEVHFPRGAQPPSLSPGSTSNWFKVADVPIANPGSIAPRTTANIEYCHSLCLTEDFAGANSMRNVVSVTVATASGSTRTFTTRSVSFPPPALDCRACCMPDGSCTDVVTADCALAGGLAQGVDSECASTECPEACCHADDTCSDEPPSVCQNAGNEPKGPGTDCASTQCCQPVGGACGSFTDCCGENPDCVEDACCIRLGQTGCGTSHSACCRTFGTAICDSDKCCAPTGSNELCGADTDCCDPNATCVRDGNDPGTCCIPVGNTGCDDFSDCCEDDFERVICHEGKCCGPSGIPDSCHDDTDCCDYPSTTCNGQTCCVRLGQSGCGTSHSACCSSFGTAICDSDKCCAPTGFNESCGADTDCCDPNATCVLDGNDPGTCCIPAGNSGCDDSFDCCDDGTGTVTCSDGKCCAPSGIFSSCSADTDCCIENETCNLSGVCCVAIGDIGCNTPGAHCCDFPGTTIFCDASGRCCGATGIHSSCDADSDCCDSAAVCIDGTCCVGTGSIGCEDVSDCCDEDRPGMTCLAETCCIRTDAATTSACLADTDCCEANAICNHHRACCLPTGTPGCSSSSQCCDSGATCQAGTGKCCAANGGPGTCTDSTDCCDANAVCNLNHTCCVPDFRSCSTGSDCCSGLCSGGLCEGVINP